MNKLEQYVKSNITGECTSSERFLKAFSYDASILSFKPELIVYPSNISDIRKLAKISWELHERGRSLPLTMRGSGTDLMGAAIGEGAIIATTAHLNRILALNTKKALVRVEPGLNFDKLQQALLIHGLFLPSYPASSAFSTIGGAIANNSGGQLSSKYGGIRSYVKSLKVVLANGDIITTTRLTKKQLKDKLKAQSFEGDIYRGIYEIIKNNKLALEAMRAAWRMQHLTAMLLSLF